MAEPSGAVTVGVINLAGIAGASVFGLSMGTIFLATSFTFLGVLGRCAYEISKIADGKDGARWSTVALTFASGCVSAATISVIFLALMGAVKVQSDSATALGLIFLGFSGARSLPWLLNFGAGLVNKITGLGVPLFGDAGAKKEVGPNDPGTHG